MLKVIGAGFGRTGTLSIKYALEQLGFGPCYHMKVALTRPWHIPFWIKATDRKNVNWKKFFRKYKATVDWPSSEFYKELMEVYPDAKIILNTRAPEVWYESSLKTIYRIQDLLPWWFPKYFFRMQEKLIWQGRFKGRFEDKLFAINNFISHIDEVKKHVPVDRLLVYDVSQGWEPLCNFLGVEPPKSPFPHYHDTSAYLNYIKQLKLGANITLISLILAILITICVLVC